MPSLADTLGSIPGYGGYQAARLRNKQIEQADLQEFGTLQNIVANMQKQDLEAQTRAAMSESGGDPEKAVNYLIKVGNTAGAHALAPLAKIRADQRVAEETASGLRDIHGQQAPQELGIGKPIPVDSANRNAERVAELKKKMVLYARNPALVGTIQREIEKLEKPEYKMRTYQQGDQSITEELQPDGTWRLLGKGPKFASQVSLTTSGELSPEATRDLAIQSLYDSTALAGYRRDPKMMSKIANERIKVMRESGITSEDVVSGRAGFKADTMSLNKITPQYDAITAFENTAIRNGKILVELANKVDTTGVPVAERWIRAGRSALAGDSDVSNFNAQMNLYRAEAARILTQPNLSGVLTDTARKEMEHVIRNDASAKQISSVVQLLERDFGNRKHTLEEQISAIRERMRGRVAPGGGSTNPGAPYSDAEKERRYQEYRASQNK